MQRAYDAMDALDEPVLDGLDELRCAVAALGNADPEPAAPPGLAPGLTFPGASLLDPKGLAREEKLNGSDEHWLDWKEGFQSSMELLNLTPYLLAIDRMVEPIEFDRLTPQEQTPTKLLNTILRSWSCLEGRAKSIYKLVPRANRFEAWKQLLIEYEPKENAPYAAKIRNRDHETHWSGRMSDFPEELGAWELVVARYQQAAHAIVPDAVLCPTVAMHAPPAVKACLRLAPTDVLVSYAALREKIFTYLNRGHAYGDEGQLQGMPMDMDAVAPSSGVRTGKGASTRQQAEGW